MAVATTTESLERAYKHVSSGWIPPQREVLEKIQQRLNAGEYDNNRQQLTSDLKEDFALYVYCLKELAKMVNNERIADSWQRANYSEASFLKQSPVEVLENCDLEEYRRILAKSHKEISKHCFEEINEFQALRFRESMISATAAEVLADSLDVDPEFGFSCALLRQLGLALVAWNYPRLYSRALETLSADTSLDASLKKVLGFSPSLLGLRFARTWNLSDEVLTALGEQRRLKRSNSAFSGKAKVTNAKSLIEENVGATLAKICEVGEALARANDPEHYPTALSDWEIAQDAIAKQLGPEGITAIYNKALKHLQHYGKNAPEITQFIDKEDIKDHILESQHAVKLLDGNHDLRHLPEDIRKNVRRLYGKFKPDKILKTNVRTLMNEIIPEAGFRCGCIYMFDPEKRTLSPAIKFGELPKERLRPVKVSSVLAQFDLVASAFTLKTPLREENATEDGGRITFIAAALGETTRIGVLYLETDDEFVEKIGSDPMPIYRALRQCVNDCLNLS